MQKIQAFICFIIVSLPVAEFSELTVYHILGKRYLNRSKKDMC